MIRHPRRKFPVEFGVTLAELAVLCQEHSIDPSEAHIERHVRFNGSELESRLLLIEGEPDLHALAVELQRELRPAKEPTPHEWSYGVDSDLLDLPTPEEFFNG